VALPPQLPDKLIPSLVKYYYSWKKTRSRTSVMDRQARRLGGRKDKEDRWGRGSVLGGASSIPSLCLIPSLAPVSAVMSLKRDEEL
jgi:hypothetical protein